MFVRGFLFLIQFALAILNKYQGTTIYFFISHQIAALLTMSIDEIGDYLKSELRKINEHEVLTP